MFAHNTVEVFRETSVHTIQCIYDPQTVNTVESYGPQSWENLVEIIRLHQRKQV